MICPRCSVGEISEATQECLVCGFSRTGGVLVESSDWSPLDDPVLPTLERQFQVEGVLRRGAASRIYLARDQVTGRLCSLKVLPLSDATSATVDQFRKDAQRSAALDHPHIVAVSSFGATGDAVWFAMEYVQGRSLGDLLRTADRMDLKTCLRLVEQIASALEYGHRRGVTHGNLKPSNVLVDPEGWARVADFGLSAAFGTLPRRQPELSFEENFGHVAPERFGSAGEAGPAADQYSLAVLAFSCLARRPPFVGETMDEIARHHLEGPPPRLGETRPDLPAHVATTLARAMSRRPADRFGNVIDFVTALSGVALPEPVATIPVVAGPVLVKDEPAAAPEPAPVAAEPDELPMRRPSPPPPPPHAAPFPPEARPATPVPSVPKPEPAVAKSAETPVAESAHPPLLFVERGGAGRGAQAPDEDDEDEAREQASIAQAKLVRADDESDDDEAEDTPEDEGREPVLLWPAAREAGEGTSSAAPESATAQQSEEERRALLFLEEARPKRSETVDRALAKARKFADRWRTLPKKVRMGGGAGAAAAVLVMAVVWWRVARGHEEVRPPDYRVEPRPPGLVDTPSSRTAAPTQPRAGTNPTTRPSTPTTRQSTAPATVANADPAGGSRPRPPVTPVTTSNDPAHLFINATPWGLLFIDDRPMGNTPRADLQIPAGMHRIRITRDGYLPYETEIAIEAGETLRLTDIVLQEKPQ